MASHGWIPPRREISFLSHRSHPQEKSGQRAPGSHPKENLGWENRKARDPQVGHQTAPPPTTTTLTVLGPDGFAAGKNYLEIHVFCLYTAFVNLYTGT